MRPALAAAVVLAALLASGCGLGGGSEGDFRSEAEAICVEFDQKIEDVPSPSNMADLVETSGEIVAHLEDQLAALDDLDPPGSLSGQFDEWMQLNEEAIANGREITAAAEKQDEASIRELAGVAELNGREADRLAHDLEIDECLIQEEEVTN